MQSSVAVPGGWSVVIRWALHEESYWRKSLKDSYLRSRKEGESLSVRLQRWDGMRQQLDRSLCQLRGHERSERKRERSADGGVLLKVCDGRESGSGRGRKRSRRVKRAVTVPLLEIRGVTDQDSFSVICHGRSGSPKGLVLLKRSVGVPDKGS